MREEVFVPQSRKLRRIHPADIVGMEESVYVERDGKYRQHGDFGNSNHTSRFKLNMNKRNRNIAAVVCIVIGICMLWDSAFGMVRSYVGDSTAISVIPTTAISPIKPSIKLSPIFISPIYICPAGESVREKEIFQKHFGKVYKL